MTAARLLAALGHSVVHTGDADEAEVLIQRGGFDVIMMDLLLENADGLALADRLEEIAAGAVKLLFISGSDVGPLDEQPWLQGPHRRFLSKPFSAAALQSELDLLVGDFLGPA